ncbi:RNA polymerase sigma factor [Thalassobellus citreus]|uniref:RNA polymerase sigma factor n=1 Tax=Thalassobellus citreus TaxID=3367752 RepID=UPI00379FC121
MKTENSLWLRTKKSDSVAYKELFEMYYPLLCSYLLQYTNNNYEAEEIAQSVFVKIWLKRNDIEIHSSFKAYLYKTAYYDFINKTKKAERDNKFIENLKHEVLQSEIEDDNTIFHEKINKVNAIIKTLPDRCKEILILSKWQKKKHKEIAEQLGISVKTVEAQLRIAFLKIREAFENDDNFVMFLLFYSDKVFKNIHN